MVAQATSHRFKLCLFKTKFSFTTLLCFIQKHLSLLQMNKHSLVNELLFSNYTLHPIGPKIYFLRHVNKLSEFSVCGHRIHLGDVCFFT